MASKRFLAIKISDDQLAEIDAAAARRGLTRSAFVRAHALSAAQGINASSFAINGLQGYHRDGGRFAAEHGDSDHAA